MFFNVGKEQYISLITKQLSNELSTAELGELSDWLSGGYERKDVLSDFKEVWDSVSTYKASTAFNVDSAYDSFLNKYDISSVSEIETEPSMSPFVRYILVGLTLLALIFGAYNLVNKVSALTEDVEHMVNTQDTPITVALVNGASAILQPDSEFSFDKKRGQVNKISGGALFDLAQIEKEKSLGFNVSGIDFDGYKNKIALNADKSSKQMETEVIDGQLQLDVYGQEVDLNQGDKLQVDLANKSFQVIQKKAEPKVTIDKENKILSFSNTPLAEVFEAIESYYGLEINVKGSIPDVHFTALNLTNPQLDQCFSLLKESIPMKIQKDGRGTFAVEVLKK